MKLFPSFREVFVLAKRANAKTFAPHVRRGALRRLAYGRHFDVHRRRACANSCASGVADGAHGACRGSGGARCRTRRSSGSRAR
jgi:hypothetical protein